MRARIINFRLLVVQRLRALHVRPVSTGHPNRRSHAPTSGLPFPAPEPASYHRHCKRPDRRVGDCGEADLSDLLLAKTHRVSISCRLRLQTSRPHARQDGHRHRWRGLLVRTQPNRSLPRSGLSRPVSLCAWPPLAVDFAAVPAHRVHALRERHALTLVPRLCHDPCLPLYPQPRA